MGSNGIQGSIAWSYEIETVDSIKNRIINATSLYDRLLREIIFKRRDIRYNLEWLQKQGVSLESLKSPVHTSDEFTAYRGLYLASLSPDIQLDIDNILTVLSQEEGVTDEGLSLAGVLLGAFL